MRVSSSGSVEYAPETSRSARRGAVGPPRKGGEGRQGEREGVARPVWLGAMPLPPEGGDDDEERKRTWTRRA